MKEQQIHWCESCKEVIPFNRTKDFTERDETLTFKGVTVVVEKAKIPICPQCNNEITDEILDNRTLKSAIELWEEKTGKKFK